MFPYAVIDAGYLVTGALYRAFDFVTPREAAAARVAGRVAVVGELWGVRWARPASAWLRET